MLSTTIYSLLSASTNSLLHGWTNKDNQIKQLIDSTKVFTAATMLSIEYRSSILVWQPEHSQSDLLHYPTFGTNKNCDWATTPVHIEYWITWGDLYLFHSVAIELWIHYWRSSLFPRPICHGLIQGSPSVHDYSSGWTCSIQKYNSYFCTSKPFLIGYKNNFKWMW